jgi:sporulation protein YlmC with PRC-barrel domain
MRSISIAMVSALALMSVPVVAQAASSTSPPESATDGSNTVSSVERHVDPLKQSDVSKITGTDVYGRDNTKIGSVSTELMNPESKRIDRLVLSTGGILGLDKHDVVLPIDKFSWDAGKNALKISITADELKSMPEWHEQSAATPYGGSNNDSAARPSSVSH